MSISPLRRPSTTTPEIIDLPGRGIVLRYPASTSVAEHLILFQQWNALGTRVARQVATAFLDLFSSQTKDSKSVIKGNLNKLCRFMTDHQIISLTDLTDEDMETFRKFIEPVNSTRRKDWTVARHVIGHANARVGRSPPFMDASPWSRRAPEWTDSQERVVSGRSSALPRAAQKLASPSLARDRTSRARLAGIDVSRVGSNPDPTVTQLDIGPTILDRDGSLVVNFPPRGEVPAHRQDFTDWNEYDHNIALEVATAAKALKRSNVRKAVTTWRAHVRRLLRYIQNLDEDRRPTSLADLDAEHIAGFIRHIDKGDVPTRSKSYRAAVGLIKQVCRDRNQATPRFPQNPWPGHAARAPVATEPLTTSRIGAILTACTQAMSATMTESTTSGFIGVTLDALFPFVVTLTFWTLFNPETVMDVRRSEIRPDLFGRFAVTGRKGRSNVDQVATFSSSDDHPCAPRKVIDNVLVLTAPLRGRLPPNKRDFLFVGLVRQQQRAKAMVQTLAEAAPGMAFHYREAFCERYGLEKFTLQQIRTTGGVICNRLFGGDVKTAQILMNHLRIATTDDYVRRDSRRVEAERIADQIEKRVRFVRTGGVRDVRDGPSSPQSAATPGFVCAEPFNPPEWLGQEDGMCAAYGRCPRCPLASVDRQCAVSFAHVLRIRNQIREAKGAYKLDAHRWTGVWKPVLDAIEQTWLPMFGEDVRAQAAAEIRNVRVHPLPPLEDM